MTKPPMEKPKMKHTKIRILYLVVFTFFLSPCTCAKALPDTAKLVPPETALLVDIADFSQLKQQFEKTILYKFYKDPAMAPFIADAKKNWQQKLKELDDNDIFKTIIDADVLPQDKVAVAFVLNEQVKDSNEPLILFITQWGENITKIKEAINKLVKKNIELGGRQKNSEDYRGVNIKTMLDENGSLFCYCFIDDCFIGATNIDLLKFVVAHIKGATSPTLASSSDYTATLAAVGPYHDIDFYVNIKHILKTIIAKDTTGNTQTTMASLGLDNVSALAGAVALGRNPASQCHTKTFLKVNGTKKGVLKMLEAESATLRTPRFIPSSAYSITFLNLDIKKLYDELYSVLYSLSPMQAAILYMPLLPPGPDGQPGLMLKTDIIDHLGSQITIAQNVNKPFSTSSMPTESLIGLATNNSKALEKSMSLFHNKVVALNNPDAKRELLGHTIYLLKLQGLPFFSPGATPMQNLAEATAQPIPTFAFTITDTHLILGLESTVEKAIRTLSSGSTTSVTSKKWFNNTKSAIPSAVGLAALQDNTASNEIIWWAMKQNSKATASGPASIKFGQQSISDLVDFNLLPEFDVVRKYFGLSASYGISRQDGFFFEFKYLNPNSTD